MRNLSQIFGRTQIQRALQSCGRSMPASSAASRMVVSSSTDSVCVLPLCSTVTLCAPTVTVLACHSNPFDGLCGACGATQGQSAGALTRSADMVLEETPRVNTGVYRVAQVGDRFLFPTAYVIVTPIAMKDVIVALIEQVYASSTVARSAHWGAPQAKVCVPGSSAT